VVVAEHLVATTRRRDRSLVEPERAAWLWGRLQRALGVVLSCVLMPDHLHLVAEPGWHRRLCEVLAGFTRRYGVGFDVLSPQPAHSRAIAGRVVRYGFFNPLRANLVGDPWSWPWSTLRDLGGAVFPAWTPLPVIAQRLGETPDAALRALTTVANHRAPLPRRRRVCVATTDGLIAAVASALRTPAHQATGSPLGRRLVVQTAYDISTPHAGRLADQLGCSERTVHRLRAPRHPALDAVSLCLSDPRLRGPA
jgi:hypothetical protein